MLGFGVVGCCCAVVLDERRGGKDVLKYHALRGKWKGLAGSDLNFRGSEGSSNSSDVHLGHNNRKSEGKEIKGEKKNEMKGEGGENHKEKQKTMGG